MREYKGFHDEPLKGKRKNQRSLRLNIQYRAIYREVKNTFEIIMLEMNKHDY